MDVGQAICTKVVKHKSNKRKFNSVKKEMTCSHAQGNWAKIMDRGDVSIEKVAEQFLVEGSEIENRDGPYTAVDYIPTSKNIPADFLHNFDQNEHYNYNEKEEEKKRSLKTKMISLQRRKMDKVKGKWTKNFIA